MERTPRLYDTLFGLFSQHRQVWKDLRHLKTFIWMLVGLIQEKNVQLPTWAPYVIPSFWPKSGGMYLSIPPDFGRTSRDSGLCQ